MNYHHFEEIVGLPVSIKNNIKVSFAYVKTVISYTDGPIFNAKFG